MTTTSRRPAGIWSRIFAALYDPVTAAAERRVLGWHRKSLLAGAAGVVVEIGAGTGANLPHYDPVRIGRLILIEPDPFMRQRLKGKIDGTAPQLRGRTEIVDGTAEDIDLPDASADVVASTLVLCSVADPAAAVAEAIRVLKPGGHLLFLEHVCSEQASVRRWQDRLTPIQRRVASGCHLNRDTLAALRNAGMELDDWRRWELPGAAGRLLPIVEGTARKAD
ncbi:class I SAM-dependent methyltransferase [Arthrobacter sp. H14]|uniref:class I SAM-dependent methyltransferase n=1 Tax=Arthrobacter sp. H14 TaxID=1312959 RepID=UPI0004B1DC0F|nr:class I SAM-dependent methyltransferase [Arthrobacter sp. H14]